LSPAAPRFLFWTLVLAFAWPLRVDFPIGPFTTVSVVDLALMLCGVYLVVRFAMLHPVRLGPPTLLVAVLTPACLAFASLLWAVDAGLTAATTIKYVYAALLYLVALQCADHLDWKTLVRACLVILSSWLLGSLAMYLDVPGFGFFIPQGHGFTESEMLVLFTSIYTRLGHPYVGQSNDFGPLLALIGFVLLACARLKPSRWLLAASWLAFLCSLLTLSRGLMVGLCASLVLFVWIGRVPLRRVAGVAGATAAVFAVLAFTAAELSVEIQDQEIAIMETVESRLTDVTVIARLEGYREILGLILDRPALGYGAGYFDKSRPDALVAAHNAFLEQWKYFGLVLGTLSIVCYLAIAGYFFGPHRNDPAKPFYDAIGCAWVFLLLTSLVETFFEATTPRAFIYFMLGLCVRPPVPDATETRARLNVPPLPPDSHRFASSRERA